MINQQFKYKILTSSATKTPNTMKSHNSGIKKGRKKKQQKQKKVIQKKKVVNKRGRKKKELELKPEEIIDYIIHNYPQFGLITIRDKLLATFKMLKFNITIPNYVVNIIEHNNKIYYVDDYGNVMQDNVNNLVGQYVHFDDGTSQIYIFSDIYNDL